MADDIGNVTDFGKAREEREPPKDAIDRVAEWYHKARSADMGDNADALVELSMALELYDSILAKNGGMHPGTGAYLVTFSGRRIVDFDPVPVYLSELMGESPTDTDTTR